MKKILLLTALIAGILIIACGNTQRVKIDVNEPKNYTVVKIWKNYDLSDHETFYYKTDTSHYKNKSAKEVYESGYEYFCQQKLDYGCMIQQIGPDIGIVSLKLELLDEKGINILPLIDYQGKNEVENRIWLNLLEFVKRYDANYWKDCEPEKIEQPRLNENQEIDFLEIERLLKP